MASLLVRLSKKLLSYHNDTRTATHTHPNIDEADSSFSKPNQPHPRCQKHINDDNDDDKDADECAAFLCYLIAERSPDPTPLSGNEETLGGIERVLLRRIFPKDQNRVDAACVVRCMIGVASDLVDITDGIDSTDYTVACGSLAGNAASHSTIAITHIDITLDDTGAGDKMTFEYQCPYARLEVNSHGTVSRFACMVHNKGIACAFTRLVRNKHIYLSKDGAWVGIFDRDPLGTNKSTKKNRWPSITLALGCDPVSPDVDAFVVGIKRDTAITVNDAARQEARTSGSQKRAEGQASIPDGCGALALTLLVPASVGTEFVVTLRGNCTPNHHTCSEIDSIPSARFITQDHVVLKESGYRLYAASNENQKNTCGQGKQKLSVDSVYTKNDNDNDTDTDTDTDTDDGIGGTDSKSHNANKHKYNDLVDRDITDDAINAVEWLNRNQDIETIVNDFLGL